MTWEIGVLLGIVFLCLLFFSFEWVPTDVVALSVVIALVLTGLLPANKAFSGFGSDTVITILGLLILTSALLRTGVMDIAGRKIIGLTGTDPNKLLAIIMVAAAGLSAFMSNTACAAFFVPVVIGLANRAKVSPSKLLLPLAFSSILSSSVTLISTSTNIVVSGLLQQYKMAPMGMFELAPVGIPITIAGLLYMYFIGRRIIPDRAPPGDLIEEFGMRPYLTELVILPDSPLVGKTLAEAALGRDMDLTVLSVIRQKDRHHAPRGDLVLAAGDLLLVEGKRDEILKIKETAGIEIKADIKLSDPNTKAEDLGMVEAILLPKSPLIGRTLKGFRFRERFKLQVLGINRHGENFRRKISVVPLRMGDTLLLQGAKANIATLQEGNLVRILNQVGEDRPHTSRSRRAIFIFAAALALGTFKIVSFPIAVLLGSVAVFVSNCITPEEAYREIEWKVIILIGSMLALGVAMEETGTASYLANLIVKFGASFGPTVLLASFFVLTILLTQPMSNQAAAVVILPVAIQTALQLDLNPRTFTMMVAVAASCSYLTPLEPACLMIYGPGRYKFFDFIKVGSILTLLIFIISVLLVPKVWPLSEKAGPEMINAVKARQESSNKNE
ncbi:MAG: SLC13 family permease [Verrucomicrobiota bacterium]|nr:SLC13 family permease [Verrucomicrobiota bacterium]